ncbi:T9SS type A sorting domain-containing protein [Cyclobacterium sp. 1_MG-2023]|uniref:T9SS type A sorting domain-containing protein n=1 Tax=Cyclobacterium sp. 1_MG-2023 TaxID=3062681 RepID=UPI0026E430EB|nr:T9SS type A sorting domain-containing protein [Cyclobacterium sp. 1_MG-2023]MDO6439241.1 T9SS type A sorting domain-containing protein [Cyclobacterium sp. 1_MG-2023]
MKLRIYFTLICSWLVVFSIHSQQVSQGEYFFNDYVDFGKGKNFTLNQGEASLEIDISELPDGPNVLFSRVKSNQGIWSQLTYSVFYKHVTPVVKEIVALEYFIDVYKDFGKGTIINLNSGEEEYLLDVGSLNSGLHVLFVRAKDNYGNWTPVKKSAFYIVNNEIVNIVALKYQFIGEEFKSETYVFDDFEPSPEVQLESNEFLANASGLEEGKNYKILVTAINDKGQSSMLYTGDFVFEKGIELTLSEVKTTDVSCFEGDDGSVSVTASTQNGDLEYSIDGENFQSENLFENLVAGEYTLFIRSTENISNVLEETFSIGSPDVLSANIDILSQPSCTDLGDGSFTVVASGGTSPLMYKLSTQNDYQNGKDFSDLLPGKYTVNIRDANGCEMSTDVTLVAQSEKPEIPVIVQTSTSEGLFLNSSSEEKNQWIKDGIEIPGATAKTLKIVEAGSYQVRVGEAGSCSSISESFQANPIQINNIETQPVSCYGGNDGEVEVEVLFEGGELEYSIENEEFVSESLFIGLVAGDYSISVRATSDPDYVVSQSFTIGSPTELSANIKEIVQPVCAGDDTGMVRLEVTGGTAPYLYKLSTQQDYQEAALFENLSAGEYSIAIKDANGCEVSLGGITIIQGNQPETPTITIDGTDEISSQLFLQSSSNENNQWLKNGEKIEGATGPTLEISEPGTYEVMLTGASGCTSISESIVITSSPEIRNTNIQFYPNPIQNIGQLDFGKPTQLDRITIFSTSGVINKTISNPVGPSSIYFIDFSHLPSGVYIVQLEGLGLFERVRIFKK